MPWHHDQWHDDPSTVLPLPMLCPGCIPSTFDPQTMQATPCRRHGGHGIAKGSQDARVSAPADTAESVEDTTNRALCDLLHRGVVRTDLDDEVRS